MVSLFVTLDISIVQYRVSVIVDGVVPMDDMEFRFVGMLFGGICTTSMYDGFGLVFAEGEVDIGGDSQWTSSLSSCISAYRVVF